MDKRKKYRYLVAVYMHRGRPSKVRFLQRAKKKSNPYLRDINKDILRKQIKEIMNGEENKELKINGD